MEEIAEHLPGARSGDPAAVDRLCGRLRSFVEGCVRRKLSVRTRRWVDIEDVVQGVLLETVRGLPGLPEGAAADELLRRVQRTAACRARDAARNHRALAGESAVPAPGGPASPPRSVGAITAADRRRWLEELVARLPEMYAVVVRLCAFEELSCVEAAARLGLEPDAVRKRYEVARHALARRLEGRDDV